MQRESLLSTPHWSVELHPDQAYLGRFLVLTQGKAGIQRTNAQLVLPHES